MKVKLNQNKIAEAISKNSKMASLIRKEVRAIVEEYVEKSQDEMVSEFLNHPVTKEIDNGPEASNISSTLGGQGNLFSYIGFEEGSEPTESVKEILENSVKVSTRPEISVNGKNIKINFPVSGPTISEIESETPMPFEGGKSWVSGVEKGISGFSYYVFRKFIKNSRSSTGIQAEPQVRTGSFKPSPYLSVILKKFYSKINAKFNI
jgi:hypothetical protein